MSNTLEEEQAISKKAQKVDSQQVIKDKILLLVEQSLIFEKQNDDKTALDLINKAWQLCQNRPTLECDDTRLLLLQKLSKLHLERQEYKKLEEFSAPLLELSRKVGDTEKEVSALTNLAIARSVASDYKISMPLFVEALEKSQNLGLRSNAANCLINIGTIYANVFNYDESLDRYKTVLNEYQDILKETTHIAINLNTGSLYYASEQYPLSLDFYKRALKMAHLGSKKQFSAQALALISRTYLAQNKLGDAISTANEAAEFTKELGGNAPGRQINLLNLAQIEFLKGNTEGVAELALRGIAAARRVKDDASELRGFKMLSDIYRKNGDFEKALHSKNIHSRKQEDYLKMQRNMHALDFEIRYALREKEQKIEELLKENRLQGMLLERNSQIEKQNEQLRQANEELQQFAFITSHDLKEPLRMIGSFAQIIQRQNAGKFNEDSVSYFSYVNEGVTRMNSLLDALLQYATIGKLDLELESVDMNEVLRNAKRNLTLKIEETDANILCGEMPTVNAVPSLLTNLFQNLISNAIKFRRNEGRPIILINATEQKKDWYFTVEDNGIGIADEHKERIFVIFQRLHTRAKYEGTGIGLSICHKIITQLGGKIWVESEPNQGSTFCFTIPKKTI